MDILYDSFIQLSIENYMKNGNKMSIRSLLNEFAGSRQLIAKIMNSISDITNYQYFSKKEDLHLFGKKRKEELITPLGGRYKQSFLNLCYNIDNVENDFFIKVIHDNDKSFSKIHYQINDEKWKNGNNILTTRCIYHTNTKEFDYIADSIQSRLDIIENFDYKQSITQDSILYIFDLISEIYWYLSQATYFKRGSASITEMIIKYVILYVNNRLNMCYKKDDIYFYRLYDLKGVDLLAIYNDLKEFKEKIKNMISSDIFLLKKIQSVDCTRMSLENIYNLILTSSKILLKQNINSICHKGELDSFCDKLVNCKKNNTDKNTHIKIINDITNNLNNIFI